MKPVQQDFESGQFRAGQPAAEGSVGGGDMVAGQVSEDGGFGIAAEDGSSFVKTTAVRRLWSSRSMCYWRGHGLRYFVGLICMALCAAVLVLPTPYVIESPGPTQDVLAKASGKSVISITGTKTYATKGKLLLTTVNARGVPGYPAIGAETVFAVFDPQQDLLPTEAVFPPGQTSEEYGRGTIKQMKGSQDSASAAAIAYANRLGLRTHNVRIAMHVDDIGGPSAGMMYALGTLNKLTVQDETGGRTIAGTGTIDKQGKVGRIGGIKLKMIAAKRDGASWFLAPASNCDEVAGHVPQGLRDVQVSTLEEAYKALVLIGKGQGANLPHCVVSEARAQ